MLDIQSHYRGALPGKPLCPSVPKMGTDGHYTYKLKWKPFFDGWVLDIMDIQGKNFLQLGARLLYVRPFEGCYVEVIFISLCTAQYISSNGSHSLTARLG